MSAPLREKVEVLLRAFEGEKVSCSFEEFKDKLSFDSSLKNDDRFKAVVEAVCKYSISSDENGEENGKLNDEGSKEMSLLADMIISHLNHGYQSSPFLDFAEEQMIYKILGYVGYGKGASGVFLPGGSYCTLISMICARYHKYPGVKETGLDHPIQVIAPETACKSTDEGAIMMGIGTNNVVKVNFDMITPKELVDIIEKNHIFMIISTFDITEDGTVDTIDKFSKIMRKYNIWHHIDACQGGTALFSEKYRDLTDTFQDAHSVTIDFHTCLNLNQQCSLLLVKDGEQLSTCSSITRPFQTGRRTDGFKLWLCDQLDDLDAHATALFEHHIGLDEELSESSEQS